MSVYAIGDTHLSFSVDKPMDIFKGWDDYAQRLQNNWQRLITNEDTVVINGDISWAMGLEQAEKDLEFINNLTFLDLNRTDLNDLACAVGKTGRLNIENDHLI